MSKVLEKRSEDILIVRVENQSVIHEISTVFDVFSNPTYTCEIFLDVTSIEDDDERHGQLCEILGLELDTEEADEIVNGGYVFFHA